MLSKLHKAVLLFFMGIFALSPALAESDKATATHIVEKAEITIEQMAEHPKQKEAILRHMKDAKAVFIAPQVYKGGFFFGGEGGRGVLLARAENGEWSYPAFYYFGAASFGVQIGAQASELLMIVKTGKGLTAIMENNLKVGGDISVAAGFEGEGLETSTTTNLRADIVSYSITQGAFIGASVEGAAIVPNENLNIGFYKEGATSSDIVLKGRHNNPSADKLRSALADFVQ